MRIVQLKNNMGFTLIEIMFSISILTILFGVVAAFQSDVFSFNRLIQTGLQNQNEAKRIIRPFVDEVRGASSSELGTYAIKEATSTSFIFYNDIDNDGLKEEIRYYLEEGSFKKGVITPSGDPLVYDEGDEKVIHVVNDVVNINVFEFYDSYYDGSASSTPLSSPYSPSDVRLVRINLVIDSDPEEKPDAVTITTQVSVRNLKDNL